MTIYIETEIIKQSLILIVNSYNIYCERNSNL